jgi:hypothetical protein
MPAIEETVEGIADDVRATQRLVRKIAKHVLPESAAEHPDDIKHESMVDLVLSPLIREWCRDAGLSTYECDVLAEGTITGCLRREVLFEGLKMGVASAVFRMQHDPEHTGEAVRAWASDEEPREDPALPMTVDKLGAYIEAEASQLEKTAAMCEIDEDMTAAAQLRGKAAGIREIGAVFLTGLRNVMGKP